MSDKLYEATKKEVMSEHEEYLNADVPKQVWVDRNKYLHEHVNKLTNEIIELTGSNVLKSNFFETFSLLVSFSTLGKADLITG